MSEANRGRRKFWLAAGALAGLGAIAGIIASVPIMTERAKQAELDRLLRDYPLVSVRKRLGENRSLPSKQNDRTAVGLKTLERDHDRQRLLGDWQMHFRAKSLEKLHNRTVDVFVDSAGFGYSRMREIEPAPKPNRRLLSYPDQEGAGPQPGAEPTQTWATDFAGPDLKLSDTRTKQLHTLNLLASGQFANIDRSGYVDSVDRVAGFVSHRMEKAPTQNHWIPKDRDWSLTRLYLVGLVVHAEPTVYLTDRLPDMATAKDVPKREIDAFEQAGLKALADGDDQFVRGTDENLRMLGSIRATNQCLKCHSGSRGDLLGAFSYHLAKAK